jgi:hypothetical protein
MCRNEALQEEADTREQSGSVWTHVSGLPEGPTVKAEECTGEGP